MFLPSSTDPKGVNMEPKTLLSEKPLVTPFSSTLTPFPENPEPSAPSKEDEFDVPQIDLPLWRKSLIVFIFSWMVITAFFPNTALFMAIPEVSKTFSIPSSLVTTSNSLAFVAMAFSTFIWGPILLIIDRRKAFNIGICIVIGTATICALAPNFPSFFVMRILNALQCTMFNVVGQGMIADIFIPQQRGRAIGLFAGFTFIFPSLAPLFGGLIVTFATWRAIFWMQTAMAGLGLVLSLAFIPYVPTPNSGSVANKAPRSIGDVVRAFNPMPTLRVFMYPNILLLNLTCGLLAFIQYTILAAPRSLPLFTTSTATSSDILIPSLFYLAPGTGFLLGCLIGGYFSDRAVMKYISKRGYRLPQDRLKSGLYGTFVILPIAYLVFCWCLQYNVGGIWLAVVSIVITGFGLMMAFTGCNTFAGEVLPLQRSEVMGGKYIFQYSFSGIGSATVVPLIEGAGIGIVGIIGAVIAIIAGCLVVCVAWKGLDMQIWWMKRMGREGKARDLVKSES